jgi:hypothetical protein
MRLLLEHHFVFGHIGQSALWMQIANKDLNELKLCCAQTAQ